MKNAAAIARKELATYLSSPMAYVVTAVFLALTGIFFTSYLAGAGYADTSLRGFVNAARFLVLLFAAVLTMRLVAEEKKIGTWELLLTVPVRDAEIVAGKFLAALAMLAVMLALTLYYPAMLLAFGDPDVGPMAASYLGLFLLGGAGLAAGMFASSITANQIVSAVVAGGLLFGLWFLGVLAGLAPGALGDALALFSLSTWFAGFERGVVDTRGVVYYVTFAALFLYLSVRSIEAGRWR